MDKKKKIAIFSILISLLILMMVYLIGLSLIDLPESSTESDTSTTISETTDYTDNNADISESTNIIVNVEVSDQVADSNETELLHGWVINNMGYTYFYENAAYEQFNFKNHQFPSVE